jgi:hypothetical protein
MEPLRPAVAGPQDLHQLRVDVLRSAIALYLTHAYPSGQWSEAVRRRLEWTPDIDAATLLTRPPFERVSKGTDAPSIFALRLGNARYPHMKLQIQPWPNAAGFLLSVNTHDQVLSIDPDSADAPAFRALQAENQRLKEAIEQAWDQEGLPTFLRYLREYIAGRNEPEGDPDTPPTVAAGPSS